MQTEAMQRHLSGTAGLLGLFCCMAATVFAVSSPCPCQNVSWCEPVTNMPKYEVFVFSTSNLNWKLYDWNKVTTVVQCGYTDPDLMCYAHSKGARVVQLVNFPVGNLTNSTARSIWIAKQVTMIQDNHLDGINIDFESAIPRTNTSARAGLTALVREAVTAVKKFVKGGQVTYDVAWSPDCIDQRCFNYTEIAQATDFVFVMSYDERSQIKGPCIAWANSAMNNTISGIKKFIALGIPVNKMVLGVPWYGYDYPCLTLSKDNVCTLNKVPFRGVNCSDAAGKEINYSYIQGTLLKISTSGRQWCSEAGSPYFNYKDAKYKQMHQVWYDDPKSLMYKYQLVQKMGLRGVGMWQADALNYTMTPEGEKERKEMWGAIPCPSAHLLLT